MEVLKVDDKICFEKCAVTVGFFDGVHSGHQFLIKKLVEIAREKQEKAVVVTFAEHPKIVLGKDEDLKLLTTLEEKLELLKSCGVDACYVLDFTKEIANLSAFEFIYKILKQKLKATTWLVGYDHRLGKNRSEGFADYQKYAEKVGIEAIQVEQFLDRKKREISSSVIRKELEKGEVKTANEMLTYVFSFSGEVVDGFKIGRKVGFPTANIEVEKNKIIPQIGVYAVKVILDKKKMRGMMNIGYRPTISDKKRKSVEVHIFDFDGDIYNKNITIQVFEKVRDEVKFSSLEKLVEQLKKDKKRILSSNF